MSELVVFNSLSKEKETFQSISEGLVGMYVCGPTVYSDVHLGNIRTFMSFDIIFRYLKHLGYKVRYVRNITDVGHLVNDADEGEDKIAVRAKLENLEPMEVVQKYSNGFQEMMRVFNIQQPSIEPRATGHIIEQIEMIEKIIKNGYAYEQNGSVYFDTLKFSEERGTYGKLSGRILEDLLQETRDLKNQQEKRNSADFAIWMMADDRHLMKWNSPWSIGFPGWHLECSAMSTKYLGKQFDIHGGGNDLKFPHHENEVAQNEAACGCSPAKYWLHANMLLMNGRKMSKSDGNTISAEGLFSGESEHVEKAYSPMVVRFFMLQAHYRSTLDLSNEALFAAEKGYKKLMDANRYLQNIKHSYDGDISGVNGRILALITATFDEFNDDFNTPKALARLFELVPIINSYKDDKDGFRQISSATVEKLKKCFEDVLFNIMGLSDEQSIAGSSAGESLDGIMQLIIELRQEARTTKDWGTADKIRDTLATQKIVIKDGKEGTTWGFN
ncbi:MAG: cysteinyl-tRNA synthetase [Saprospiraceae bacterium]|jgi:cysteinyl-tRNA synthetase